MSLPTRFVALMLLLVWSAGCQSPGESPPASPAPHADAALQRFEYVAPKMGTGFRIVLYAPDKTVADRAAEACWARVDQLNAMLSDYDPNSEISRLSQRTLDGPMSEPATVSDDLFNVLERAMDAARRSGGAFDVTVGPLVRLWRRSRQLVQIPKPERVAEAQKSVGYQHVKLDGVRRTVQLLAPRMVLDVGGIAKGYTSSQVLKLLRERFAITRALCGAAGDIGAGDAPPGKAGWTVALESVEDKDKTTGVYVRLNDAAVSTSGDTERFVVIDDVRYSHIVNPRTGLGLTERIGVTVVAPDPTTTDWMSTAISILGPERGLALVEQTPGAAARITKIEDGKLCVWESKRFAAFVTRPKATAGTQPAE